LDAKDDTDVLGLAGFSFDLNSLQNPQATYVTLYNRLLKKMFTPLMMMMPRRIAEILPKLPFEYFQNLSKDLEKFDQLLYGIVEERKKKKQAHLQSTNGSNQEEAVDLLDLMVSSLDDESGHGLTNRELRDNMMVFFIAGHETTANSLSFALYFLAKYPEIQEKARKEILDILGDRDHPTYEDQKQMEYLLMIVKESMRHYPPVSMLPIRKTRECVQLEVDGKVYSLPKGSFVSVFIYGLHHNPNLWSDPEKFIPERFAPGVAEKENRHFFSWNPFGGGSRACIGQDFSLIEQRITLSSILKKYDLSLRPGSGELKLKNSPLVTPDNLLIKFTPRT